MTKKRTRRCFKGKRDFESWVFGKSTSSQLGKLRQEAIKKKVKGVGTVSQAWTEYKKAGIVRSCK